jgi:TolA-binding protein
MSMPSAKSVRASIPAMPNKLRSILLALVLAASAAVAAGCGGDSGPDPSIDNADATTLVTKLEEISANVDVDSPCVAEDRTGDLISDIQALPSSVDADVRQALDDGANNLQDLLSSECEERTATETTTTEPTTTEETTTERTQPTTTERTETEPETTTETQPTPTQPGGTNPGGNGNGNGGGGGGGASGGIGPGGL